MVKEYLEEYQTELLQKKIVLEKKCNELKMRVKENIQFIILLEEENDSNYESFIPREINPKNRKKIEILKKEQIEVQKQVEEAAYELSDIEDRLAELSSVIKIARQNEINQTFTKVMKNDNAVQLKFLETQEKERQRIARDLHDSTVQSLTGMIYKTEICSKLINTDTERCKKELKVMSKTLHEIIDEMRNLIYDLRPMSYDDMGLNTTVERALSKLKTDGNIKLHYKIEGNLNNIKSVISLTILRIVQEACNNIIKHAEAKNVNVSFIRQEGKLSVIIEDDGKGFDTNQIQNLQREDHSGCGISMMQERVYLLSGHFDIISVIGEGTTISVSVPLT